MAQILEIKEFFSFWKQVHESILHMASLLSPDDLNYTCDPKLKPIGRTFYHIAEAYDDG